MGPNNYSPGTPIEPQESMSMGGFAAELALVVGGESFTNLMGGGNTAIFGPNATRGPFVGARNMFGRMVSPQRAIHSALTPGMVPGTLGTRYGAAGGSFDLYKILGHAEKGKGAFKGMGGTGAQRLADKFGTGRALQLRAAGMGKLLFRGYFAWMNFDLGMMLGKGFGDLVSTYESPSANRDITMESGGFFADTRASYTQRQQAIQTIHNSQLTTRAALGNEAAFIHRG